MAKYRLLLFKDGTSSRRGFAFNHRKLLLLIALILAISGTVVYTTSHSLALWLTQRAMASVLAHNRDLKSQLARIEVRLNEINYQLDTLANSDDQLRLLLNLPQIDEDMRQVGIGGAVGASVGSIAEDQTVRKLIFDLDKIEREIRLQFSSFAEITRKFAENEELIAHTPSIRPVEGGFISSQFGNRIDPFTRRRTHHNGIDISVERGTPVYAPAAGKVVFAERTGGLGKLIIIDHGYGFSSVFGHLSKILVYKGEYITREEKIGEVGNTGRSTAPHLHYEVRMDGRPVDPLDYIFQDYATLPF